MRKFVTEDCYTGRDAERNAGGEGCSNGQPVHEVMYTVSNQYHHSYAGNTWSGTDTDD